jgi:transcriptional regulator with XRE-family HTH domain
MHEEWSKARVIDALAALEAAGMGRRKLSEMAGVDHSTIGRWARGQVKPDYPGVRRLAIGIWRTHPELARELVEASGWPWQEPPEAEPEPLVPPELVESLRRLAPETAEKWIAELEDIRAARSDDDQGSRAAGQ